MDRNVFTHLMVLLCSLHRGFAFHNSSTPSFLPISYLADDAERTEFSAAEVLIQKLPVLSESPRSDGANILILHPIYAGSHEVVLRDMGLQLVKRGHSVTQLRWKSSHRPIDVRKQSHSFNSSASATNQFNSGHKGLKVFPQKYMDIITVSVQNENLRYPYISKDGSFQPPTKLLWDTERSILNIPTDVFRIIDAHCSTLLGDPALIEALNNTRFSMAFVDIISNECSLALAKLLNLPVVGYWGFPFQGGEARRMGVYQMPSVVPMMMSELSSNMNIWQRLTNMVLAILDELLVVYQTSITDYWIQMLHPSLPPSATLLHEIDVMLVSVDWAVDFPKLMPPHVRYIGCLMCRPPFPLEPALDLWVTNAGNAGVILFTFGLTGFDSDVVPEKFKNAATSAFAELDQRVILHFDPDKLDSIPSNVLTKKMVPQQDLLGHPQCQLFVSHCGMNSVNEALFHGKPLICIPNFADQGDISRRVVERGVGLMLSKNDLNKDTLVATIREVTQNPTYRNNAERISRLWHMQPTGLEQAMMWVERVHQHGFFNHWRSSGSSLSFFQYFCIDVIIMLLVLLLGGLYFIVFTVKWIMAIVRSNMTVIKNDKID